MELYAARQYLGARVAGKVGAVAFVEGPLGRVLKTALADGRGDAKLDLGRVAAHGRFGCDADDCYTITLQGKPATAFLFELIARLQATTTVPMIDIRAYAKWLAE